MSEAPVVYIAGDWKAPPEGLANALEETGCTVSPKWWVDKASRSGNLPLLMKEVEQCDVFVLDMRGPRFGDHYYAGSHIGLGMAVAMGKQVHVIPGEGRTRLECYADGAYTSLAKGLLIDEGLLIKQFIR